MKTNASTNPGTTKALPTGDNDDDDIIDLTTSPAVKRTLDNVFQGMRVKRKEWTSLMETQSSGVDPESQQQREQGEQREQGNADQVTKEAPERPLDDPLAKLSEEQRIVLKKAQAGRNVFFTGSAGKHWGNVRGMLIGQVWERVSC